MNIGIDATEDAMIEVKSGEMNIAMTDTKQHTFIHGTISTELPDMQIPVGKFDNLIQAVSTFDGEISLELKDRLIIKGRNVKRIPLTKWKDIGQKVMNKIKSKTEKLPPVSIKKQEYEIVSQDKNMFKGVSSVFFVVKDRVLSIEIKDTIGFESITTIENVDIPDGRYILPTMVFNILQKVENLEIMLHSGVGAEENFAYFRDVNEKYTVKYVLALMKQK